MPFLGRTPTQFVDPEVDINGGAIDGTAIGASSAAAGTFTNLTATGTLTLPDDGISGDDVNGGTISNFASTGIDDNATSTAITIDASQNVGIGTASPTQKLELSNDSSAVYILQSRGTTNPVQQIMGPNGTSAASTGQIGTTSNHGFRFVTNNTEHMRIDSSGNLLVGKTSTDVTVVGTELRANGLTWHTTNGIECLGLNRLTSDGKMLEFRKDGTTVGNINTYFNDIAFGNGDTGLLFNSGSDQITPFNIGTNAARDNAIDLGASGARFDDIYATNGTIQTSDANEKQDIEALSEAETRVAVAAKALLRKFRWKSAVEEKGDEARIHFGVIAQDLKAAFEAEGLDAGQYGMFIHSTWTDEETGEERSRMGVRYSELLAFIIAAI